MVTHIDVGIEVLVCGGNYCGEIGIVTRKTNKRFEIRRIDGLVFQVAKYNVIKNNKTKGVVSKQILQQQMSNVKKEVVELKRLLERLVIIKKEKPRRLLEGLMLIQKTNLRRCLGGLEKIQKTKLMRYRDS